MNITSYVDNDSKYSISHGRMSIQPDYSIINADEGIYKFLGANSGRPLNAIIHPDDLESFYECINHLGSDTEKLLLRIISIDETYRMFYAIIRKGEHSIDFELVDIANIYTKYDAFRDSFFKCRKLMNNSPNMFFEYSYSDKTINIYEYINERCVTYFYNNIDEVYDNIMNSDTYSSRQKQEFGTLYDYMTEHTDNVSISIDGELFGINGCTLNIKGGIVYKYGEINIFAGIIRRSDQAVCLSEKYYQTPAAIDMPTGTYNKRAIGELASDVIRTANGARRYVIMIDIDDFKDINDTFGHMTGDKVIATVAHVLKSFINDRGYVGRFGGDEFFIITDRIHTEDDLMYLLKTIKKNISYNCEKLIYGFDITISIGVSCYPTDGNNYEELLSISDKCLYLAKAKGKNRHVLYRPSLHGDLTKIKHGDKMSFTDQFEDSYHMCNVAMSIINDLRNSNCSDEHCFNRLLTEFKFDRISVFKGDDYDRVMTFGCVDSAVANLSFLNDVEATTMIDSNGLLCVNKILNIKEKWPAAYDALSSQGNQGILIFRIKDLAISFDLLGKSRKMSDVDKGLFVMISNAIADRILRIE